MASPPPSPPDPSNAFQARIVKRTPAGGGMTMVTLLPEGAGVPHTRPGQYIEVRAPKGEGFFALANEPGAVEWQLIVRGGGDAADALLALPLDARVDVVGVLGDGFPYERARGRPLFLVVTGTGIAAARPVLLRRIADGEAASTELLFGVRAREDLALADEIDQWKRQGVRVVVCLSQADVAREHEGFVAGYVQDMARVRVATATPAPGSNLPKPLIFVAGSDAMVEALRGLAPELGMQPGDICTNY